MLIYRNVTSKKINRREERRVQLKAKYSRSFLDGFDHSTDLVDEIEKIKRYEKDILRKIKLSKEKKVSISKYTAFNSEKTKRLRPNLYEKYGKYIELSFSYSEDSNKLKNDWEIIRNFEANEKKKGNL